MILLKIGDSMKKISYFIILLVMFFMPFFVSAKANFELKAEIKNQLLLEINNGNYTFINANADESEAGSVLVYNSKGDLVEEASIIPENTENFDEIMSAPYFIKFLLFMYDVEGNPIVIQEPYSYVVSYNNETISFNNTETEENGDFKFSDNVELTRKILGKKYDVYLDAKKANNTIANIREYNGYYIVCYYDESNDFVSIMDENYKIIKTFESSEAYDYVYYAYDKLIYVLKNSTDLEIYKTDGSLYQTFKIDSDKFDNNTNCNGMFPIKMIIEDSRLFVIYAYSNNCEQRIVGDDIKDYTFGMKNDSFLTIVYDLNFDIEKVESSNGEFTYESKIDEDGKEYIELKITPKEGYSIENIIVTDASGNKIEVNNNRFYKPLNDVKIEVTYINGEYVPIPNTALNSNVTFILISVILIGLGLYVMNFVKREEK